MIARILLASALMVSPALAQAPAHPAKPVPVVTPRHSAPASRRAPPRPAAHRAAPVAPPPAAETPAAAVPAEPGKGSNTGLPLPRFVSLRGEEVNLRSGPGTRYPIEWVYKRRDLPVEIQREFEVWRLVQDQEGVKGWVHQAVLVGRRTFLVTGAERVVRTDPKDDATPVAMLKPGVIGRIRSCEANADWCQVQVQDYRGWMKRTDFWGSSPGEAIQ